MSKCKGVKANGSPCKSNRALENGFCKAHQDQFIPEPVEILPTSPVIHTTTLVPENRVLTYGKNPPCPKCGAHPTVCMLKNIDYMLRRCMACGHRFEIDRRPVIKPLEYVPGKEGNLKFKLFTR